MSANAFESGARRLIPAVLIYVKSLDDRVLMIHRDGGENSGDFHQGKWNGLGGKLEADESPLEAAHRELREESGLELPESSFRPLGTLQFPNFKPHKSEDWLVFVVVATLGREARTVGLRSCSEGTLHWVAASELLALNLWPGDRHFIPLVREETPFLGTIWYHGQEVRKHQILPLDFGLDNT